jgi:nucleoside-diphosphate-sugar epimerase
MPTSERVLLAGATGVVGRRLLPLLLRAGYEVLGTTRSTERSRDLERAGARPVVVDFFDAATVGRVFAELRPAVVIHQLTDLAGGFAPEKRLETLTRNTRIRREGTRNLMDAARATGVRRVVAQSIVWMYAPGPEPYDETAPLDVAAEGERGVTVGGVVALEQAVLETPPVEGVVLRYGWFYGPGARPEPAGTPGVHVDAAAQAALLAVERGRPGPYNVADPSPVVAIEKARRELGWDPQFRAP